MNHNYRYLLNALIAEHVMGLKPQIHFGEWPEHEWPRREDGKIDIDPECARCGLIKGYEDEGEACIIAPQDYAGNAFASIQVYERMLKLGYEYATYGKQNKFTCTFRLKGSTWSVHARTMPLAVGQAALKALAVEIPKEEKL